MNIIAVEKAYKRYNTNKKAIEASKNEELKEEKQNLLCSLLESIGFTGIDASIEESLLYYGMVRKDETVILYNEDLGYNHTDISIDDIKEALSNMDNEFYDYIDSCKEEYNKLFESEHGINNIIFDIRSYKDLLTETLYFKQWLNIDEIIQFLENNYINK